MHVPEERWSELLQVIDKSEREPPEKTAERLGPLAAPVQQVLEERRKQRPPRTAREPICARAAWPIL